MTEALRLFTAGATTARASFGTDESVFRRALRLRSSVRLLLTRLEATHSPSILVADANQSRIALNVF